MKHGLHNDDRAAKKGAAEGVKEGVKDAAKEGAAKKIRGIFKR